MGVNSAETRLLVITGAGASTLLGARGNQIALMREFCSSLVGELGGDGGIATAFGLSSQMNGVDFERRLGQILRFRANVQMNKEFLQLGKTDSAQDSSPTIVKRWSDRAASHLSDFVHSLNKVLFAEFGPDAFDLAAVRTTYSRFLNDIRSAAPGGVQFAFATTNYDLACEAGLEAAGEKPDDGGRRESIVNSPMLAPEQIMVWNGDRTPVLHLHGAVGWYLSGDQVRIDPPQIPYRNDATPAILYPDPEKNPLDGKGWGVHRLWRVLDAALRDATHVVIVGHSLHDVPVLDAIATSMRRSESRLQLGWSHRPGSPNQEWMGSQIEGTFKGVPGRRIRRLEVVFDPEADFAHIGQFLAESIT